MKPIVIVVGKRNKSHLNALFPRISWANNNVMNLTKNFNDIEDILLSTLPKAGLRQDVKKTNAKSIYNYVNTTQPFITNWI